MSLKFILFGLLTTTLAFENETNTTPQSNCTNYDCNEENSTLPMNCTDYDCNEGNTTLQSNCTEYDCNETLTTLPSNCTGYDCNEQNTTLQSNCTDYDCNVEVTTFQSNCTDFSCEIENTSIADMRQVKMPKSALQSKCSESNCNQKTDNILESVRNNPAWNKFSIDGLPRYCDKCSMTNLNQLYRIGSTCDGTKINIPLRNTQISVSCHCAIFYNDTAVLKDLVGMSTDSLTTCTPLLEDLNLTNLDHSQVFDCNLAISNTVPNINQKHAIFSYDLSIYEATMSPQSDGKLRFSIDDYNIGKLKVTDDDPEVNDAIQCLTQVGLLEYVILASLKISNICSQINGMLSSLEC